MLIELIGGPRDGERLAVEEGTKRVDVSLNDPPALLDPTRQAYGGALMESYHPPPRPRYVSGYLQWVWGPYSL